jgi:hypothetical protein
LLFIDDYDFPYQNTANIDIIDSFSYVLFYPSNDQDQRGEPEGLNGGTAIVEASAESTCWAVFIDSIL